MPHLNRISSLGLMLRFLCTIWTGTQARYSPKEKRRKMADWTHETNLVHLWVANDSELYNEMKAEIEDFIDEDDQEQDDVNGFANWLQAWVDEMVPDMSGIVADLFACAISEVDWYALAEFFIEDERENMDYTSNKIDEEYAELCAKA